MQQVEQPKPSLKRSGTDGSVAFYVGTYTGAASRGIHALRADLETGALVSAELAADVENPSFLALSPDGRHLFAALELPEGEVAAFEVHPDGRLELTGRRSAKGSSPCHLCVDPTGRNVLVANYDDGNVASLPIRADGRLGEARDVAQHEGRGKDPKRQEGPHAHAVYTDPTGRVVFAVDLGIDRIVLHGLDPRSGQLEPHDPPAAQVAPGSGPRHLALHPTRPFVYVANELSNTVTAFRRDEDADALASIETLSTLPARHTGASAAAEIAVHPNGRWLYVSNRGHDSLAAFSIDERSGRLTPFQHVSTGGKCPRHFAIAPDGRFLLCANQDSDRIEVFRIHPNTGELSATGGGFDVGRPVCVLFAPGLA